MKSIQQLWVCFSIDLGNNPVARKISREAFRAGAEAMRDQMNLEPGQVPVDENQMGLSLVGGSNDVKI